MSEFSTQIIGNVGRDPEIKEHNGKKIAKYSVATKPSKDKTVWVDITTWDKQAELDAQYVHKGMLIKVNGTLQSDNDGRPRVYKNKDGETKAENFSMTGYQVRYLSKVQPDETAVQPSIVEEEIPF